MVNNICASHSRSALTEFTGDDTIDQIQLEDDLGDMEIAGDGGDEEEITDDAELSDDVSTLYCHLEPPTDSP
jgi:hypothetical protein